MRIDSTPGRETLVVNYLKQVLEAEGIPTQTFALDPDRANLVARLKGNGSKRPLLILAHTDVVPVQREKWPVDPFGAEMKDGYIWGRGTKDDKPVLAANLMTMLLLKRRGVALDRDVIFLAESAEEADTTGAGINFMVREHFDAIDAEFAITEGGGATLDGSRVTRVSIGTAEKLPARARLVATGTAGHGSVPRLDNPLLHLAAALDKLGRWQTPMRLNDTTRTYFERLATICAARARRRLSHAAWIRRPRRPRWPTRRRYLQEHDPASYSMLRTSIVPTILKAGVGANVIPSEAEATLDIRALPGEDIERFYAQMTRDHRRPGGEGGAHPAGAPAVAGLAHRHRDVSRARAGGAAHVSRRHGAAGHVHRRQRSGAAAREGHPVVRHRSGLDRGGRAELSGARRRGAAGRVVALSVRRSTSVPSSPRSPHASRAGLKTGGSTLHVHRLRRPLARHLGAERNPKPAPDQRVDEPGDHRQRGTRQTVLGQGSKIHGSTVDPVDDTPGHAPTA